VRDSDAQAGRPSAAGPRKGPRRKPADQIEAGRGSTGFFAELTARNYTVTLAFDDKIRRAGQNLVSDQRVSVLRPGKIHPTTMCGRFWGLVLGAVVVQRRIRCFGVWECGICHRFMRPVAPNHDPQGALASWSKAQEPGGEILARAGLSDVNFVDPSFNRGPRFAGSIRPLRRRKGTRGIRPPFSGRLPRDRLCLWCRNIVVRFTLLPLRGA